MSVGYKLTGFRLDSKNSIQSRFSRETVESKKIRFDQLSMLHSPSQ